MAIGRLSEESGEYRKLRDELQTAEVALRDQRERVAELRRQLPRDSPFADAEFSEIRDGEAATVRLSELFEDGTQPLILMHFMFGKQQTHPCPMCTAWADGYDGILPHLARHARFVLFIAGDPGAFGEYARSRGWRNLRIVSAADSDVKARLGFEDAEGAQHPGLSVFERDADGAIHHFYSQSADLGADGLRGMDLLNPLWHFIDCLPQGRGNFFPAKAYD
jgi:predicted dithiol-disulfide oxidoreductase (DUF899 family)